MNSTCSAISFSREPQPASSSISRNLPQDPNLEYMASVAHDMRNPLSVIAGATHILKEDVQLNEAEKRFWLDDIFKQTQQLALMLDELLDRARKGTNSLSLHCEYFDLTAVIEQIILEQKAVAPHRALLCYHTNSCFVNADRSKLTQVVNNLISNAIKYSGRESSIFIDICREESQVILRVRDQGIGMTEEEIQQIFQPFVRLQRTRLMASGSGVGLSSVKQIIDAHGGQIRLRSREGHGTTIEVSLPQASVQNTTSNGRLNEIN